MDLTIQSLESVGAFTGAPVEKEITWKHGGEDVTATVYVRKMSYKTAISDIKAVGNNGDVIAGRIAACICDKEGKSIFTPEDITGDADPDRGPLDGNLTMALLEVIGEVNGLGKQES
jgi:hypothetical protein